MTPHEHSSCNCSWYITSNSTAVESDHPLPQHVRSKVASGSDDEDEESSLVGPPIPPGFDLSSAIPGSSSTTVLGRQVADELDSDEEQIGGGEDSEVRTYCIFLG